MDLPKIPGHTVLEVIGQGRTGPVYKGIQDSLQRDVAIKVISRRLLPHPSVVREFLDKARAAAGISHPSIISIYNVDQTENDLIFYTMEFLPGGSLADRIDAEKRVPLADAARLLLQVGEALHAAHQKGAVHGNLKPSKILFMEDETAFKLSGVGLTLGVVAKHSARNPTPFTAPEVIQTERPADHRADIFAMGGMLYQMLVGKDCFNIEQGLWRVDEWGLEVVLPSQAAEGIPREVDEVMLKMMAFDPEARYQQYADVFVALRGLAELGAKAGRAKESKEPDAPAVRKARPVARAGDQEALEPVRREPTSARPAASKEPDAKPEGKPEAKPDSPPPPVSRRVPAASRPRSGNLVSALLGFGVPLLVIILGILWLISTGRIGRTGPGRNVGPVVTSSSVRPGNNTGKPDKPEARPVPAEEPRERINDLMAQSLEAVKKREYAISRKFHRAVEAAQKAADGQLQQGDIEGALTTILGIYEKQATSRDDRDYALAEVVRGYVDQIDGKLEEDLDPARKEIESDKLAEAKASLRDLMDRYPFDRWQEKIRAEMARVDQLLRLRTGGGESKREVSVTKDFREQFLTARKKSDAHAQEFRFEEAAAAYDPVIESAPSEELKWQARYTQTQLRAQGTLFLKIPELIQANLDRVQAPLKLGELEGVISRADENGFYLKVGGGKAEARVPYTKMQPQDIYRILYRLPMGGDEQLGLVAYCYRNNMVFQGEKLVKRAVLGGSEEEKRRFETFQQDYRRFLESGGMEEATDKHLKAAEAKQKYLAAVYELALGQEDSATAKLRSVIRDYPETASVADAKRLLDGDREDMIEKEVAAALAKTQTAGPSGMKVTGDASADAEEAFRLAMESYRQSMPGQPDRDKFNELALTYFRKSQELLQELVKKEPDNPKRRERLTQVNRLLFFCVKSRKTM